MSKLDQIKLNGPAAAALVGVAPSTWRRYTTPNASRGGKLHGPAPDGYGDPCGCPWWYRGTVKAWQASRPKAKRTKQAGEGS